MLWYSYRQYNMHRWFDMHLPSSLNGKRVGKISPWVIFGSSTASVIIIVLAFALLSTGTEKAIAFVVALIAGAIITVVGGLKTFKPE